MIDLVTDGPDDIGPWAFTPDDWPDEDPCRFCDSLPCVCERAANDNQPIDPEGVWIDDGSIPW